MGTLFVDKLDPQSGTSLEIGSSGDTITIPSGASITNSGTATGFGFTSYGASAYPSGAQSISSDSYTKVTLGTEYYDTNSEFADSRYTAGTAGNYLLSGSVGQNGEGPANTRLYAAIYKNGSLLVQSNDPVSFGTEYTLPIASIVVPLAQNDYIELYFKHNKGSALSINGVTGGTYLNVLRVS